VPLEARRQGTVEKFLAKERSDWPGGRQEVLDAALDGEGRYAKLRPRRSAAGGVDQGSWPCAGLEAHHLPSGVEEVPVLAEHPAERRELAVPHAHSKSLSTGRTSG
jgi:hypothetical protein